MRYSVFYLGGTCEAWIGCEKRAKNRGRLGADLFGSLCYTLQHGRFRNMYGDLTRIDARLDIASASEILKTASNVFRSAQCKQPSNELSSPRLNLIFQQQVSHIIHKCIRKTNLLDKFLCYKMRFELLHCSQ